MIDKFSEALALMREAFADAAAGALLIPGADLAAEVDGAQKVINAASAVQALRVAQYAGRDEEQDGTGAWVEVDHGVGHVSEFAEDCFGPMSPASGRCPQAMGPVAGSRPPRSSRRGCRAPWPPRSPLGVDHEQRRHLHLMGVTGPTS